MLEPKSADEHNVAYSDSGCPAITPEMQSTQIMAGQPSSHTWLSSHHPTTAVYIHDHKGCPAFKPLVYFHHQNCHEKINRKFNRKINREINRNLHFFIVFLIFIFQSRNQSRKFLKTTILLKKNCFQSQIEFVQKSIVRLNFFNLGAFGEGKFTGKMFRKDPDGSIFVWQPNYAESINRIEINKERKKHRYTMCDEQEISLLRTALGALSWLAKETRPDLSGRVALLQQSMPTPRIQDLVEANLIINDAKKFSQSGVRFMPIQPQHLRVGVISDASWGNAKDEQAIG